MPKSKKPNKRQWKRELKKKKKWLDVLAKYSDFIDNLPEEAFCGPDSPELLSKTIETIDLFAKNVMHWERDESGDFLNSEEGHLFDSLVNMEMNEFARITKKTICEEIENDAREFFGDALVDFEIHAF